MGRTVGHSWNKLKITVEALNFQRFITLQSFEHPPEVESDQDDDAVICLEDSNKDSGVKPVTITNGARKRQWKSMPPTLPTSDEIPSADTLSPMAGAITSVKSVTITNGTGKRQRKSAAPRMVLHERKDAEKLKPVESKIKGDAVTIDDQPAIEPSMFDINLDSIPLPEDPAPKKNDINDSAHPVDMEMSDDEETEHGESEIRAPAEDAKEESPEPLAPPGVSPETSPRAFFGKEPSPAFASQPTRDPIINVENSQASKPASPIEKPQLPSPTTATSASASSSLVSSPVFSDVADPEKTHDILVSSTCFQLVDSQEALHLTTPPPPPPPPPLVSVKEQSNPVEENQTTAVKFSLSLSKDSKDARRSIEIAQRVKEKEEREKERQKAEAAKKKSSNSSATAPSKTGVEMLFKEYGTAVFEKQKLEEKKREEEKKAEQKRKEEERRKAEKKAEERKKEEKKLREEKRKKREEEDKKREEEKKKKEEERLKKEKDERTKKEDDKKRDKRRKAKEKEKDKHHHSRKREGSSKANVDGVKERTNGDTLAAADSDGQHIQPELPLPVGNPNQCIQGGEFFKLFPQLMDHARIHKTKENKSTPDDGETKTPVTVPSSSSPSSSSPSSSSTSSQHLNENASKLNHNSLQAASEDATGNALEDATGNASEDTNMFDTAAPCDFDPSGNDGVDRNDNQNDGPLGDVNAESSPPEPPVTGAQKVDQHETTILFNPSPKCQDFPIEIVESLKWMESNNQEKVTVWYTSRPEHEFLIEKPNGGISVVHTFDLPQVSSSLDLPYASPSSASDSTLIAPPLSISDSSDSRKSSANEAPTSTDGANERNNKDAVASATENDSYDDDEDPGGSISDNGKGGYNSSDEVNTACTTSDEREEMATSSDAGLETTTTPNGSGVHLLANRYACHAKWRNISKID